MILVISMIVKLMILRVLEIIWFLMLLGLENKILGREGTKTQKKKANWHILS